MFNYYWVGFGASQENWVDFGPGNGSSGKPHMVRRDIGSAKRTLTSGAPRT